MSKVGVLGGTFDPLHYGHLRAAEVARDALTLDRVLFVPASNPPHKLGIRVTDANARAEMIDLALAGEKDFDISRLELERGGPSYTIETLDALQDQDPTLRLSFITGSDAFVEIGTWKDWEVLLTRYAFAVHERPGVPIDAAEAAVPESYRERIAFLTEEMLNVSSTEIRRLVRSNQSIRFLVPDVVADYIHAHRLYQ